MESIRSIGWPLMIGAATTLTLVTLTPAGPALADPEVSDTTVAPTPVPHLSSPNHLPPGTVADPPPPAGRMDYLRDLWQAVQTQEISGGNALLLLTQMPMQEPAQALPDTPQQAPTAAPDKSASAAGPTP